MGGPCRLLRAGAPVEARWRRDGDVLVVSPAGAAPLVVAIERVAGIAGDGHAITLRLAGGDVALERLGADGPTLLGDLRRDWPALRAKVLRLDGGAEPAGTFAGSIAAPGVRGAFRGVLAGSRLLLAVEDGDLLPLFLADFASVAALPEASAVRCGAWDGSETTFGRLGAKLEAFSEALLAAREALSREADETVGASLPTLAAAGRASLAAQWLPGRLLSFAALEAAAPGFETAFRASWLPALPRAAAGVALMEGVAPAARLLGHAQGLLWLLAMREGTWHLELLSDVDHATYLFRGGDELPRLAEGLVRLPEFSREALYLPLEQLVGERSAYAVPARELPLLSDLRERFKGRAIHKG